MLNRKDTRNIFRAAGINPYSLNGAQRRALRKYANNQTDYDLNMFTDPTMKKAKDYYDSLHAVGPVGGPDVDLNIDTQVPNLSNPLLEQELFFDAPQSEIMEMLDLDRLNTEANRINSAIDAGIRKRLAPKPVRKPKPSITWGMPEIVSVETQTNSPTRTPLRRKNPRRLERGIMRQIFNALNPKLLKYYQVVTGVNGTGLRSTYGTLTGSKFAAGTVFYENGRYYDPTTRSFGNWVNEDPFKYDGTFRPIIRK